jgi:hypothetical protein
MKRLIVRIGLGIVMGGLLWGGLPANQAMATLVTFNFTGAVTSVGTHLSGGPFSVTQPVTGSYTFESTTGVNVSGTTGTYNGALDGSPTHLNVTIGTYVASLAVGDDKDNKIEVKNTAGMSGDAYAVKGFFSGDPVQTHDAKSFELSLTNPSGNPFNSVALPTTPPSLNSFAERTLRLVFENGGNSRTVIVALGPLTAVPLPPAVILFGAGLIALVGFGAGGWRKRITSLA